MRNPRAISSTFPQRVRWSPGNAHLAYDLDEARAFEERVAAEDESSAIVQPGAEHYDGRVGWTFPAWSSRAGDTAAFEEVGT